MAQYRKDIYSYLQDNKTLFEVVMLAVAGAANGDDALGAIMWEEIT